MNRSGETPMKDKKDGNVVKVDAYRNASASDGDGAGDSYRGLHAHARVGLHEFVADKIGRYLPRGGTVLDLGAGSGAMAERMLDMGLIVTASDIVEDNFRPKARVPFLAVDLNERFSEEFDIRFDGITAVEIMEHLENPRNFLRECGKLLKDGGSMILSTPNVDNPLSKGMFLKSGIFQWFTDYHYDNDGHIMPITQWMMRKMVAEAGFTIEWAGTYGNPSRGTGVARRAAAGLIRLLCSCSREMAGEILVVVARKTG